MRIGEITQSETLYELEKWATSHMYSLLEDGMSAEKVSKSILQRAVAKFKKQPEPSEEKNNRDGRVYGPTRAYVGDR